MTSKLDKLQAEHADNMLDAKDLDDVSGGKKDCNYNAWVNVLDDGLFLSMLLAGTPQAQSAIQWYEIEDRGIRSRALNTVTAGWAACGIRVAIDEPGNGPSQTGYWLGGNRISREEAINHAMSVRGKKVSKDYFHYFPRY